MAKRRRKSPIRYYSAKRRAIYAKGDVIDRMQLFDSHNWICNICAKPINKYIRLPNHYAATIEHIIPLCKGGTHTWDNVAPAHAICNFQKSDSTPDEFSAILLG